MPTYNETGSGGIVTSGIGSIECTFNLSGSGGIYCDSNSTLGNPLVSLVQSEVGIGNCLVSGEAIVILDYLQFIGGVIVGGDSIDIIECPANGGVSCSGEADIQVIYLVNGNCLASGTADTQATYNIVASSIATGQGTFVDLLSILVSGKASATVDLITDYQYPVRCENENDDSGSSWTDRFAILTNNSTYVKNQLTSFRSKGLNCFYDFNVEDNSTLLGVSAIAYGKWWTSLLDNNNQHQLHLLAGLSDDYESIVTLGQVTDGFINPIKNQTIYFGDINDPIENWIESSAPTTELINNSNKFGLTYYFESVIDDSCLIDTIKMRIRYRQDLNP